MARILKYETKKGELWMFIIENGIDAQTGNRRELFGEDSKSKRKQRMQLKS